MDDKTFYCCLFYYKQTQSRTRFISPLICYDDNRDNRSSLFLTPFGCWYDDDNIGIGKEFYIFPCIYQERKLINGNFIPTKFCSIFGCQIKDGPDDNCYTPLVCFHGKHRCTPLGYWQDECQKGYSPFVYCDGKGNYYPYNCSCEYTSSDTLQLESEIETNIAKMENIKQRYKLEWLCGSCYRTKLPPSPEIIASLQAKKRELIPINNMMHAQYDAPSSKQSME